jgi:2-hydroxy-6-oxo-6-(2'-carboxyphenyl)-hexa-2,4-dienoate hydrolase
VCGDITIEVPDRVHIQEASLENLADPDLPFKILTIEGGKSHDLSNTGEAGFSFPAGKWLSLSLLTTEAFEAIAPALRSGYSSDKPFVCKKSSVQALVKIEGQQRYPAKIVIRKLKLEGGEEKEGVAYIELPPPAWASAMRDEDAKYIEVNGIRTRYFEKGKGDALLLVHGGQAGATSNAQNWEQNFDYLVRYFHVYALDRLGQGYTDNPKTEEDYEKYYTRVVDHVYGFLKAVDIKKVHLIGHSQGGWPVTRLALDHPEMVKSLVIVDSGTTAPSDPLNRGMPFFLYTTFYVDPPEGTTRESIRRGMELWSYSMNNITREKVQRAFKLSHLPKMIEARKQMKKHRINPAHPTYQTLKNKTLEEIKEGKLKVPTLVIWGHNDPSTTFEVGIELFKNISSGTLDSQLHIFNNCGHSPYMEYPDRFNRLIRNLCGKNAFLPIE